jgi:hypothetical protein
MSEDLEDTIASEVSKAQSMSSDAGSVSRRSLRELIETDQYLSTKRAAANANGLFGLRVTRLVPGSPAE